MSELSRLKWRCRRGKLELDLILQRFAKQGLEQLSSVQQKIFEELLDFEDDDLYELILDRQPGEQRQQDVLELIRGSTDT